MFQNNKTAAMLVWPEAENNGMMEAVVEVKQKKLGGGGEEYVSCFRKTAAEERKGKTLSS